VCVCECRPRVEEEGAGCFRFRNYQQAISSETGDGKRHKARSYLTLF
jgi:hypothetical protein